MSSAVETWLTKWEGTLRGAGVAYCAGDCLANGWATEIALRRGPPQYVHGAELPGAILAGDARGSAESWALGVAALCLLAAALGVWRRSAALFLGLLAAILAGAAADAVLRAFSLRPTALV